MIEKIFEKIEVIEPFPAVYIDSLDLIVIADLHLGYETAAAEEGMFIPKIQYKKISKDIEQICRKREANRVLINGDVKHEFSDMGYHEYKEVSNFFEYMKRVFDDVIIVKGNHDTFLSRITRKHHLNLFDEFHEGEWFFTHGHNDIKISDIKEPYVVIGHEHPSLCLISEIGVREKVKCFLYGEIQDKNMLVLPAFSYFAQGSDVNLVPKKDLLSPILRNIDIDSMKTIGIIEEEKCLPFPKISLMRDLYEH